MFICQIRGNLPLILRVGNPEPSPLCRKGVETRRQIPQKRKRDSPDFKPERGSESYGSMHNRLVPGSSPGTPTIL